ncbi:MAG: hypothetical protein N2484_00830 [Clostridia bacterium]|nr:hypothetical protein [Clostridia bacterium]
MKNAFTARIEMPDITRIPEIVQPEPNPARELPSRPDPEVQPDRVQQSRKLIA